MVLFAELETESLITFRESGLGEKTPHIGTVGLVGDLVVGIKVEVLVGREKGNVRLLQSQGDEEGLFSVGLVFHPTDDLTGVLAVLVLSVGQSASSFAGGSLGVEFGGNALFELLPFFLVWLFVDRAVLGLELQACFADDCEFVVFESQVFVPGNVSMIAFGVVEDLAHAGGPVPVLLEELGHGNRARSDFPDVEGVVEDPRALRVQTTQEGGSGRATDRILAKGPVECDRFLGELGKVGGGDGFVSGGGNMRVEIIADHEEDVLSFGLGWFRRNQRRDTWPIDFGFPQVSLACNPLVGTILDEQVPLGIELFGLRGRRQ